MTLPVYFLDRYNRISGVNYFGYNHQLGQLSLASIREVAKSSTSFGCGEGGRPKVIAAGW